ncbi:flagellin N-terminal helical domain-containing protein [Acetobacter pasteurianus]|uniref:flagellin N-terminal helical domain-containing protein n=1 Tax=Acetobacter pasteurianus TaxID=438 RepID=UPI0013622F2E|nr:flagellin [Acetobacter pasteurianus]QHM90197.1 flagellin [Acetobacter pasteurianus]
MSLSVNTNNSSMVALETLNSTQSQLSATENAVSTGKKVATAADNPAAFGIASQINGDTQGQAAVNDGLSYASSVVSSTTSAANNILSVLNQVQEAVTGLKDNDSSSTSLSQVNEELTGYMKEIDTIARDATTKGVNLLSVGTGDGLGITSNQISYVTGLQGDTQTITGFSASIASDTGSTGTISVLTDALGLTTGSTAGADPTSNVFLTGTGSSIAMSDTAANLIDKVQNAITAMTNVTSKLGANTNMLAAMSTYGEAVSDDLTSASGALTDADMSSESAKLTSLQTKQSLAIKSLSIANGESQNVLSLFQ